jgi:uncharacterized protein (TIGR02598 family)
VGRRGFSLVEVTMALGLIAVGLLTMMGLVPIGLNSMHDSQQSMVRAQIFQSVSSEAMLTSYTDLGNFISQGPYYYDGQGQKQAAKDERTTRFVVELSQKSTQYPGSSNVQDIKRSISTLGLAITAYPGARTPVKYVVHIPNQGG